MSFILLTRSLDDTIELEKSLSVPTVIAPLLTIELIPQTEKVDTKEYTALIVTSARALMIFSQTTSFLKKSVWCVGHKTALTAKKLGFEAIYTADNSAEDLYRQIVAKTSQENEKFLHICGETLQFDIVEALVKAGYQAKKLVIYRTIATTMLKDNILASFKAGEISLIPIYSKKTSEILAALIKHYNLEEYVKTITVISCSPKILEPLQSLKWQKIMVTEDLSTQTLEKVFNELKISQDINMPRKFFWTLMGGAALLSALISIGSFYALTLYEKTTHPSLQIIEAEKQINSIIEQQKKQSLDSISQVTNQVESFKTEIGALKEVVETLKQQQATAATPLPETSTSPENFTLKASLLVTTLLDDFSHDIKCSSSLWQQLPKTIEKTTVVLPEKLKNTLEPPETKQSLIQQIQAIHTPDEPSSPSSTDNNQSDTKNSYPWLKKFENFIGRIEISKETAKQDDPLPLTIEKKAILAIQSENIEEIKKMREDTFAAEAVKAVLTKVELRNEIIQELIKVKQELLEKIFLEKE